MTAPRLGSLWRLTPQAGGHVVLVATANACDRLHALLAVDRLAGPEDVVLTSASVTWTGAAVPLTAIACRQQTVVARGWLSEELGLLGQDECDAVGWLSAPPPARDGIPPPARHLVGSNYSGLDDPRLVPVRAEAAIARGLLEAAHEEHATSRRSAGVAAIGALGERLLEAARDLVAGVTDVIGAQLEPATVLRGDRGPDEGMRGPDEDPQATLNIPRAGRELLGERVRSQVVLEARSVDVWLSGVTRLAPGDVVVLMALTPAGLLSEARAALQEGSSLLSFELEWLDPEPPVELALAVVRA
jgi:hypothetical protein